MQQLDPEIAWRAVWLLDRAAQDHRLTEVLLARIASLADGMTHWLARMILCQLFVTAGCPIAERSTAFDFLADCFADRRVLVRAWAISALATFADDVNYSAEVEAMLRKARSDRSKSMQARLRHLQTDKTPR